MHPEFQAGEYGSHPPAQSRCRHYCDYLCSEYRVNNRQDNKYYRLYYKKHTSKTKDYTFYLFAKKQHHALLYAIRYVVLSQGLTSISFP